MILQIKNDLILADLTVLDNVSNPVNGECYFITSEGGCYSYYSQKGKVIGFAKDSDAVIYSKASILESGFTDVTVYFPNVLGTPTEEIKEKYRIYELDGKAYFEEIRAGLVIQFKMGNKTSAEIFEIESKLENTTFKDNIVKECKELFHDKKFMEKLDENPYLIGFENGIYDLVTMEFRDGRPDDYLTLSTGIDYEPFDEDNENYMDMMKFIETVFPQENIRDYFLMFLSTCLLILNS